MEVPLGDGALDIDVDRLHGLLAKAGKAIEAVQAERTDDGVDVSRKGDGSPVTAADIASNDVLVRGLSAGYPQVPIVSEETWEPDQEIPRTAWVIDPLDGTKEFIKRNGEYVVNVGLMEDHQPVFGAVHVPTTGETFMGGPGLGAWRITANGKQAPLEARAFDAGTLRVVASRSHAGPLVEQFLHLLDEEGITAERVPMGSAWKLVLVAQDRADCYPRLGPTMWWDTLAPQAVVEGAGGRVLDAEGGPFRYVLDRDGAPRNRHFLVVGPAGEQDDAILASFSTASG